MLVKKFITTYMQRPKKRKLSASQNKELEQRLRQCTLGVTDSFWEEKSTKQLLAEAKDERFSITAKADPYNDI